MLLFFISFFDFSLNSPVLLSYSYIIPRYTLSKLLRLLVHCLTQLLCLALIVVVVVVVVGWPFRFSSCAVLGSSLCLSCCCCCCYKPSHIYLYKGKMLLATAVGWLAGWRSLWVGIPTITTTPIKFNGTRVLLSFVSFSTYYYISTAYNTPKTTKTTDANERALCREEEATTTQQPSNNEIHQWTRPRLTIIILLMLCTCEDSTRAEVKSEDGERDRGHVLL